MAYHFAELLAAQIQRLGSPVVVVLDPRWGQFPHDLWRGGGDLLKGKAEAYITFCTGVPTSIALLVLVPNERNIDGFLIGSFPSADELPTSASATPPASTTNRSPDHSLDYGARDTARCLLGDTGQIYTRSV